MAEPAGKKGKKSIDSFADDLDSMLGVDEPGQQQVGLIDDDDAIDRLLMGDVFPDDDHDQYVATEAIDQLLEADLVDNRSQLASDDGFSDDIDDIIAGIESNRNRKTAPVEKVVAEIPDFEHDAGEVDLTALETVGIVDDFDDDLPAIPNDSPKPEVVVETKADDFDGMTEIDEFSDLPANSVVDNADFLLADFNISVDDDINEAVDAKSESIREMPGQSEPLSEPALKVAPELASATEEIDDFADEDVDADFVLTPPPTSNFAADDGDDFGSETELVAEPEVELQPEPVTPPPVTPSPVQSMVVDHSAELAALTAQINELKKLQKQTKHEFELKSDRHELASCLETIESLQTEQKKNKRNLDGLINQKPVGVYVANGVAAAAIMVAVGLWIDSFITKSQVQQLVDISGQLKQQIESAPAADAADKELLRKQVEELAVAQSIASAQLAELGKGVQSGDGAQKPSGDLSKQLSELSNQDMQMGGAIEALQNKVAALEKGRLSVATPAKPVVKKPVVVAENWAVNLIAFKQDWYAKRKADEFTGKGVPAKVSRTESKGETWYRLSVDGFSSQYEAAAYAAKVKKTLNLDSVWVAKNKD
jgi:ribonuclease HI